MGNRVRENFYLVICGGILKEKGFTVYAFIS